MDKQYWQERWKSGNIGWHQAEVEPALIKWFSDLPPTRVLVPLCGKSRDLEWLASKGHEVIGVELSALACEAFFTENGIPFEKGSEPDFTVYRGPRIRLLQGDFFALKDQHVGGLGAIYDRAALIALPADIRKQYAFRLAHLARGCLDPRNFKFLQVVLEREPPDEGGPPYSVSAAELRDLYEKEFEIKRMSCEEVEAKAPAGSGTQECIYSLSSRWVKT